MSYLGDVRLEDTFDCKFVTTTSAGVPTVLAGSPIISAYPGNSTTQLTAGITLTVDFDGVVGLNNIRVVATAANGYATATNYALVITTGTVNAVSVVGYVPYSFSIEARSALRPATVARNLNVSAAGEADANVVKWLGTAAASPTTAGVPEVDVTYVNGSINAAVRMALAGAQIIPFTVDTAGFTPTTVAFETSTITEATASHFNSRIVLWTTGALAGQIALVEGYTLVSGRGHFVVTTMTEANTNGDTGVLV